MLGNLFEIKKFDNELYDKLKEQKKAIVQSFALSFPHKIHLIHEKSKIAIFAKSASALDFFSQGDTGDIFKMATICPQAFNQLNSLFNVIAM